MKKMILLLLTFNLYAQKPSNSEVLIPFREKKLWGLSDTLGNLKVKPIYKEIKSFFIDKQNDTFLSRYVVKTNKSYFVINKDKKVLLPETNSYDSIKVNKYYPNHFWIYKKGKTGLYHKNKEIIACQYDFILPVQNQSYRVEKDDLMGLINASGKLIIPIQYQYIRPTWDEEENEESEEKGNTDKFIWIAENSKGKTKFYDAKTPELPLSTATIYEKVLGDDATSEDTEAYNLKKTKLQETYDKVEINTFLKIAYVTKNDKKGVIDLTNNQEIISLIYDDVVYANINKKNRFFKVRRNGKYGLIQAGNKAILNCEFDDIDKNYILTKDNRKGIFVLNTIYPYIKTKYLTLKPIEPISISDYWQFGLFEVTTEKGKGYVGENGVDFFKD